jgi:hypothetical protein
MHRGEYLQKKMKENGFTIDMMSSFLDVNPATVWRWLKKPDVQLNRMKLIADVMKIDLRPDFPESENLYTQPSRNYEMLYLKEMEKNKLLEEELAQYRAKAKE